MGSYSLKGIEFLLRMIEKFWKWIVLMFASHCEFTFFFLPHPHYFNNNLNKKVMFNKTLSFPS